MLNLYFPITQSFDNRLNWKTLTTNLANVILQITFSTSFIGGLYGT